MPAPPRGNDSSGALDHSLATLFQFANEEKQEKETTRAKHNDIEADARVDQLVGLLNCYANWELRGLLVAVLQDGKIDSLVKRLGTEGSVATSVTDEISSSSNEKVAGSSDVEKKSLEENFQPGITSDRRARRSSSREDLRALAKLGRSTSISRRTNSTTGRRRISRSLSADKQISDMASGIKKRDIDTSSRQSAILARRRELDNDSSTTERPRDRGKTPPKSSSQTTKERRSLTPTRSLPTAPTSFRRPMRQRSGSAENMLGLLPNSSHGGRRSSGGSRLARNHTVGGTSLGISLHGTNSGRTVPSRSLQRSNSLRISSEELNNDKAGLEISTRSTGRRRSSRLPRGSSLESVQMALDHETGPAELHSDDVRNAADDKDCYKNREFLQFHPGPEDAQVKTCSQKVETSNIVDELKLSTHNPIKIDTDVDISKIRDVPSAKKSFSLFRSMSKRFEGIELEDKAYDSDSDAESIVK